MTILEKPHESIQASSGTVDRPAPELPATSAPLSLPGIRRVESLSVCNEREVKFSNCPLPGFWLDRCDPAWEADPVKCSKTVWDSALFRPFSFYDLQESPCVDPSIDPQAMANQVVSESTAWAVTTVLQNGGGVTTTTLENSVPEECDLTPDVAVDPCAAISALMRAMAGRGLGRSTIHAPFWALPLLETAGIVKQIGGTYRTSGGITVNFGLGFTGVGPDSTGNIDAANDDEVYFYVTRDAVEFNIGPIQRYAPEGTMIHHRTNTSMAEALRQGIVAFDPGCTYAIRVCLRKLSCCA